MQKQTIPLRVLNGPAAPPAGAAQKFWNIVDVSDEEAEITMYGEVVSQRPTDWWTGEPVEGLYITPEGFLEDLAQVKDKAKITVRINSVGGDLYTALGICNRLKELNGDTVAVIDGIATVSPFNSLRAPFSWYTRPCSRLWGITTTRPCSR